MAQEELTIDELARATGMTVRNIRSHATRGLLPPPEVRARTGFYGPEHIARLKLIRELQDSGYNLAGIKHLLGRTEDAGAVVSALLTPYEAETPEVVTEDELRERFGPVSGKAANKALKMGLVVPLGEGQFEVPSPALLRAGDALVDLGVPLERVLTMLESVSKHTDSIAQQFVRLFMASVWAEGMPPEAVDRLRPLATEAVVALFHQRMSDRTEKALARELDKQ